MVDVNPNPTSGSITLVGVQSVKVKVIDYQHVLRRGLWIEAVRPADSEKSIVTAVNQTHSAVFLASAAPPPPPPPFAESAP